MIANFTPLVDLHDSEAEWGFICKGPFKGFKLHIVVNQLGLPLKAMVTPLTVTIHPCFQALADAGCDSKSNIEAVEAMGAEPVIAPNPRRGGKRKRLKHGELLKAKRYLVEQFNGLIKNHVLK